VCAVPSVRNPRTLDIISSFNQYTTLNSYTFDWSRLRSLVIAMFALLHRPFPSYACTTVTNTRRVPPLTNTSRTIVSAARALTQALVEFPTTITSLYNHKSVSTSNAFVTIACYALSHHRDVFRRNQGGSVRWAVNIVPDKYDFFGGHF
jgi:hypothetical protein